MKNIFTIFLLVFLSMNINMLAQGDNVETLFGSDLESGGYGGPEFKLTSVQGELALMIGGRGGWIINHVFSIGLGGYGLVTSHQIDNYAEVNPRFDDVYLRTGWGGVVFEYINSSNKLVHFTINALIGAGGATYTESWDRMNNYDNDFQGIESSAFFVLEPGITVDFNFMSFMRIGLGASYRIVSGIDLSKTDNSDLSGPSANLIFKLGTF